MAWTSALAIYLLFWVLCAFLILPFGIRTHEEVGAERVTGQAESAPHEVRAWRIVAKTTLLSLVLFGLFYLNYVNGWISAEDINLFHPPE